MRKDLERYFESQAESPDGAQRKDTAAWRLACFDNGCSWAEFVEEHFFSLDGRRVLDSACAWGGHALAFAQAGADVVGSDIDDHDFAALEAFGASKGLSLQTRVANCEELPFESGSFDVILGFELLEHIQSPERYASEVARLLTDDGIAIVSTPARWRSFLEGEPHFEMKGLTILPFSLQRMVAERFFGRSYRAPITRQYSRVVQIIDPFKDLGLQGASILSKGLWRRTRRGSVMRGLAEEFLWAAVVLSRRGFEQTQSGARHSGRFRDVACVPY